MSFFFIHRALKRTYAYMCTCSRHRPIDRSLTILFPPSSHGLNIHMYKERNVVLLCVCVYCSLSFFRVHR